ncbi:MAG: hypothetical protein J4473_04385 [Candidatus Aenigmarchaeota archaeon]|nr:hypothetical protein [Candidatus Aenigmarchaeota archaeon]
MNIHKLTFLFFILIFASITLAYELPIYVANPNTYECKYYFAGDEKHFNPRPENFNIDIGPVTEFKDENEACEFWKCSVSKGKWTGSICDCPGSSFWSNATGCTTSNGIPVISDKEKCDSTNGVWKAELCSCLEKYHWDKEKGCIDEDGNPGKKFDSKSTGILLWVAVIIAAILSFVAYKFNVLSMINKLTKRMV